MINRQYARRGIHRAVTGLWAALVLWSLQAGWAQDGQWTAHTSMREVVALSASDEALWAATSGGVFSYLPESGEIERFTAAEGLHSVQTQAIAYDSRRGAVWAVWQPSQLPSMTSARPRSRGSSTVSFTGLGSAGRSESSSAWTSSGSAVSGSGLWMGSSDLR